MKQYSDEQLNLLTQVLLNVAVQLRGAMANIYASAQRLAPPETRDQDETLDSVASVFSLSYYQMYRVIENLNDAARLTESGLFTRYNDDIVGLCRTVCEKVEGLFAMNGVTLSFAADRDSCIIGVNAEMIEKMLLNLLSNALKFTPCGGRVSVRVKTNEKFVQLSVADTGRGIAADRLDSIFDRFLETDRFDPAPHGLGLGLALCRRIAQGHGGMIVAESEEGKGATFTVSLPNVKTIDGCLHDVRQDYSGGFNQYLVQLSDALRPEAFTQKYLY